jgi:hypothetical protein
VMDLSYREALTRKDMPVQRLLAEIVQLWEFVKAGYEDDGSPFGPASAVDNVVLWVRLRSLR